MRAARGHPKLSEDRDFLHGVREDTKLWYECKTNRLAVINRNFIGENGQNLGEIYEKICLKIVEKRLKATLQS